MPHKKIYCGQYGFELSSIIRINRTDNVVTWFDNRKTIYFQKARAAIRYACDLMKIRQGNGILFPSYYNGSELDALISTGAEISIYRVDDRGKIDINDLQQRINPNIKLVYITHYFGFIQPMTEVKRICKDYGLFLIEDCVLSLFSQDMQGTRIGSESDIAIYNFNKSLPVPDGGAAVINNTGLLHHDPFMTRTTLWQIRRELVGLMKPFILRTISISEIMFNVIWKLLRKDYVSDNNNTDDTNNLPAMSHTYYYDEYLSLRSISFISRIMLRHFSYKDIILKRRANYLQYLNALQNVNGIEILYKELPVGVCPLYFPIIIKHSRLISYKLRNQSIYSIQWWSGFHKDFPITNFPEARRLKRNLLVLPVHQQLNENQIDYIIQQFKQILNELK